MAKHPTGTATFLFTDIEGSTRMWQDHPQGMQSALAVHDRLMREAIESHAGYVFSTAGDAFSAAFSRAADAVAAAVEAQRKLADTDWGDTPIRVRMGLHTGEGEERGGDYFGPDLNRGARLMAAAHGGQIAVSEATAQLVGGRLPEGVTLVELGPHRLKDLARPETIYQLAVPGLRNDFPLLRVQDRPDRLPVQLSSFVGRASEIEEVNGLLDRSRLLTLTGVGGVGKTRIALRLAETVADTFDDGVFFVELGSVSAPESVAKQIAVVMGVQERADQPMATTLVEGIARRQALVVLDNCEHLVAAIAAVSEQILRTCHDVRLLATSREPLGIPGEQVWAVPPLPVPAGGASDLDAIAGTDAVGLFVDRARLVDPSFSLSDENAAACAEVCRRLDGLPLAIELAAARVGILSPRQIADRLDDRLSLLTKGARTALPRQHTLRAAIDWSYDLLTPDEQRLFRRLSVFRGGCTLEALEAVAGRVQDSGPVTIDLLSQLVDKSLVMTDTRSESRRFTLSETIRQYAWEQLEAAGESESTALAHSGFFAEWAAQQGRLVSTTDQIAALSALESDHENVRAVLDRSFRAGDYESALKLAADVAFYWWIHSHFGESGVWFERLLEVADQAPVDARAKFLVGAGEFAMSVSDYEAADERLRRARQLARDIGGRRLEGWALAYLMTNDAYHLENDTARAWGAEAQAAFEAAGDALGIGYVAFISIAVDYAELWATGSITPEGTAGLIARLEPMLEMAVQVGERNLLGHAYDLLGPIEIDAGRLEQAPARLAEAVQSFDMIGNQVCLAHTLDHVAMLANVVGRTADAVTLLGATSALRERVGVPARPVEQAVVDDTLQRAKAEVDDGVFEAAWAAGRAMQTIEAVALANEVTR